MEKLLEFLAWLVKALFGRDSESPAPETPRETPVEEAVTGWEGDPPYRYIDVSRYQGAIDWAQVAAAGYKGAMLKTVSTNTSSPNGQTACTSTPPLRTITATPKRQGWM